MSSVDRGGLPSRVAITGASGFIGSHLADALRQAGCGVVALSRHGGALPGLESRAVDIRETREIASAIEDCQAIVHLAAVNKWGAGGAKEARAVNVDGTRNLVAAVSRSGVRHIVFPSTGKVYRAGATLPIREDESCDPTTELGRQKFEGERLVRSLAEDDECSATVLRIFNAYGPGQPGNFLIPRVAANLTAGHIKLANLEARRDFVHVEDVTAAIITALSNPPDRLAVYNVGSGSGVSVAEVVEAVSRLSGAELEVELDLAQSRRGEPAAEYAAIDRLRALGWGPPMDLEAGLRTLVGSPAPQ
jgi:nucleoside-diphosphate-sugar epimerase